MTTKHGHKIFPNRQKKNNQKETKKKKKTDKMTTR